MEFGTPLTMSDCMARPGMYHMEIADRFRDAEFIAGLREKTDVPGLYIVGQVIYTPFFTTIPFNIFLLKDLFAPGFVAGLLSGVNVAGNILGKNLLVDGVVRHLKDKFVSLH